ncbi:hypothetical protein D3C73_1571090 [compost metagenome]
MKLFGDKGFYPRILQPYAIQHAGSCLIDTHTRVAGLGVKGQAFAGDAPQQ